MGVLELIDKEDWVVVREMLEMEIFGGSTWIDNDSYLDTRPLLLSLPESLKSYFHDSHRPQSPIV